MAAANPNDPFAAMGGGVQLAGGQWVPANHPLAAGKTPTAPTGTTATNTATTPAANIPATGAATGVGQQATNAQTYSATPAAAPTNNTTNQGVQDVTRNTYLRLATQGPVDRNNPNVRAQADAYGANVERARRQSVNEAAERMGPYASGALDNERRLSFERAGQATGTFESELVGREIQNQRQEVMQALGAMGGMISDDQRRALEERLADLDAALRREGLGAQTALGNRDLDIRDRLGQGDLNLRGLIAALQNRQFGQDLGFRIGATEAELNNSALRGLFT
jgi:hypothetical protein